MKIFLLKYPQSAIEIFLIHLKLMLMISMFTVSSIIVSRSKLYFFNVTGRWYAGGESITAGVIQFKSIQVSAFPWRSSGWTLRFHCHGPGFDPWLGNWDPISCAAWLEKSVEVCVPFEPPRKFGERYESFIVFLMVFKISVCFILSETKSFWWFCLYCLSVWDTIHCWNVVLGSSRVFEKSRRPSLEYSPRFFLTCPTVGFNWVASQPTWFSAG